MIAQISLHNPGHSEKSVSAALIVFGINSSHSFGSISLLMPCCTAVVRTMYDLQNHKNENGSLSNMLRIDISIRVTSHERRGAPDHQSFDSFSNSLLSFKGNIKSEGNPLVTHGFPSQRASNVESASVHSVILITPRTQLTRSNTDGQTTAATV